MHASYCDVLIASIRCGTRKAVKSSSEKKKKDRNEWLATLYRVRPKNRNPFETFNIGIFSTGEHLNVILPWVQEEKYLIRNPSNCWLLTEYAE